MTKEINVKEFAEKWLKKYFPRCKKTFAVGFGDEGDEFCVYFNRKVGGYDTHRFTYDYAYEFSKGGAA